MSLFGKVRAEASGMMTRSNSSPFASFSGTTTIPVSGRLSPSPSTVTPSSVFARRLASFFQGTITAVKPPASHATRTASTNAAFHSSAFSHTTISGAGASRCTEATSMASPSGRRRANRSVMAGVDR